jgi:adenosylmethionine-8-amino-7-oxononanoate aminotransferase
VLFSLQTYPAEAELGSRLTSAFQANGLLLRGSDNMNVAPPLCVTSGEIDEIITIMDNVFTQVGRDLG